jgi:hypothetical protein
MNDPKRRMSARNFGISTFKFNRWSAELTEDQSLEDALKPEFWVDLASQVMGHDAANPKGRGDIIEVRKLDTGLYAELIVTEVNKGFLKVRLQHKDQPAIAEVSEGSPLTTKWNVGKRMHDVIRKADGQVLAAGFQSKDKAIEWIDDHLRKMAA